MNLRIGEKFDFYANGKKSNQAPEAAQVLSPPVGETTFGVSQLGGCFFSFFKAPVRNTIPLKSISLLDAYNYIVGDYAKQRTEKLRSLLSQLPPSGGQGVARQFKASTFDYCTFSGMFQTRNDKALISQSGLLCIDFDHLQSVDLLRKQLLQDEYFDTQMLFVSPSGDGLKWIISIDTKQTTHSIYFAAVANYILQTYGVEVDKSGRDISRACFLPHDPQAYINPLYKPSTL
ncbi:MAG: BT4734/BF3469 family protein [Paludibacteraceae bacterium]